MIHKATKHKKDWGYEDWLHNSKDYCGKILTVFQDKSSSWHYHKLKNETFYIQSGIILLEIIDNDICKTYKMQKGDIFDISKGTKHRFTGLSKVAKVFEVSTQHFDDDSIKV
jgi:mannose-6-phosphate isomerase-like protein (cupin superfamily)